MFNITEDVKAVLDFGHSLATEKYYFSLFHLILSGCIKFTNADGGIFYAVKSGKFVPVYSFNNSLGLKLGQTGMDGTGDEIVMDSHNIISCAVAYRKIIKSDDIYNEKMYDSLRTREFDAVHNYRTKSMMVVPIFEMDGKSIAVLELYNCMDEEGNLIPFSDDCDVLVDSLTSMMSINLSNMLLIQDLEDLLGSFVEAMTTAVDARTPYNANHTKNVARLCMEFVDYLNELHTRDEYNKCIREEDREELNMAAMLHDIGKMITPREVLNKSSRLGSLYDGLVNKLEKIRLLRKIDMLEGRYDSVEWTMEDLRLCNFIADLPTLNIKDFMTEDDIKRINYMGEKTYIAADGTKYPYLDADEKKALSITKGTLTKEERQIVEEHVVYTDKMLEKINFNNKYRRVRTIASSHHEYLNGTGYPKGLMANDISDLTRILTIADIYDSLTSNDRPYKGTVPVPKALGILDAMVKEGKLDIEYVRMFTDMIKKRTVVAEDAAE